jgi:hypothetical protein
LEADPFADGMWRVLNAVEALAMDTPPIQYPDHALDHYILPWAQAF